MCAMDVLALIEIDTFTGLPAHPFLNRIAMYIVPTSLALSFAALVRPAWRRRLVPWSFALAVLALLSVQITMGAGEVMDNVIHRDSNPLVEEHEGWSKLLRIALVAHVLVSGGVWWAERRSSRDRADDAAPSRRTSPVRAGMLAGVGLTHAATAYLTVMTAHSGSKSVYQEDGEILTALPVSIVGEAAGR